MPLLPPNWIAQRPAPKRTLTTGSAPLSEWSAGVAPKYTEKAKQGLSGSDAVLVALQAAFASLLIWQIR